MYQYFSNLDLSVMISVFGVFDHKSDECKVLKSFLLSRFLFYEFWKGIKKLYWLIISLLTYVPTEKSLFLHASEEK